MKVTSQLHAQHLACQAAYALSVKIRVPQIVMQGMSSWQRLHAVPELHQAAELSTSEPAVLHKQVHEHDLCMR